MDWNSYLINAPLYIAGISAIMGALIYFYKKVLQPMFRALLDYDNLSAKIEMIVSELTPNNDSSMKDALGRVEREMAFARERHRAINADTEDAQFETDLDGNCTWVNRTYTNLAQRTPSELYGHGWVNAIFEDEREEVREEWYKAVDEHREFSKTFHHCTPSGVQTKVKCVSYRMDDGRGNVLGYYGKLMRVE